MLVKSSHDHCDLCHVPELVSEIVACQRLCNERNAPVQLRESAFFAVAGCHDRQSDGTVHLFTRCQVSESCSATPDS